MLFRITKIEAVPVLPIDSDAGKPADGRDLFTIEQAAERTGTSKRELLARWIYDGWPFMPESMQRELCAVMDMPWEPTA
jgi:hypothetical protein